MLVAIATTGGRVPASKGQSPVMTNNPSDACHTFHTAPPPRHRCTGRHRHPLHHLPNPTPQSSSHVRATPAAASRAPTRWPGSCSPTPSSSRTRTPGSSWRPPTPETCSPPTPRTARPCTASLAYATARRPTLRRTAAATAAAAVAETPVTAASTTFCRCWACWPRRCGPEEGLAALLWFREAAFFFWGGGDFVACEE